MSKPDGGPALPSPISLLATGMMLRDVFAITALLGIMTDPNRTVPIPVEQFTRMAFEIADAMLAERAK